MPYTPPPSGSGSSSVPTVIVSTATFTVAADTQVIIKAPVKIDGIMKIVGTLVQI